MSAVTDYAFLNSRVSVMAAQLLPRARLEAFIDDPEGDHRDFFEAAGLTPLADDPSMAPRELEQLLANTLIDEAMRLARGMHSAGRELIHHFVRRFEMVNLKILIRCKLAGCTPEQIRERLFDLSPLPQVPSETMLHAEDVNECLRLIEAGRHAVLAHQLRQVLAESQEVFLVEAAIDYGYFSALYRKVRTLPMRDRQVVQPFIARVIDQVNLVWLMRYRLGYGMTPPHTFFLLIRASGQLDRTRLAALAQLDSLEAIIAALPPAMAELLEGVQGVSEVEERFVAARLAGASKILAFSTFNLARALGYLMLREQQMRSVHEVLKGRVLNLPPDLIRRAIGAPAAQEAA
jgi:V/A-type H+-transporting ATPase subunit C